MTLNETGVVHGHGVGAQDGVGLAHLFMALHLFGTDVQQPDRRPLHAMHGGLERFAHDGELDQLARIAADVGPDVQNGGEAALGGPTGDDGGALQPIDRHAQDEFGYRHQGAGVARRDGGLGLAGLDRLDGVPQARALAPAHGLGGLFVHGDNLVRVADLADIVGQAAARHLGANRRLVAMQQEADAVAAVTREISLHAADHDGGTEVPAHGVERDQYG
ncbi:hypothetical protein D3C77_433260 [compost metagenome]